MYNYYNQFKPLWQKKNVFFLSNFFLKSSAAEASESVCMRGKGYHYGRGSTGYHSSIEQNGIFILNQLKDPFGHVQERNFL